MTQEELVAQVLMYDGYARAKMLRGKNGPRVRDELGWRCPCCPTVAIDPGRSIGDVVTCETCHKEFVTVAVEGIP